MTRQEFAALLSFEENVIPQGRRNRPGTVNIPNFITIHNTDNSNVGADAKAHGRFLINTGHYILNGKQHWVSWHYTVDDRRVVKHLPLNEKAFHAASANAQSVAIEVCMNQGIDQSKAFLNAARLSALLLFDLAALNKDVNKVVPHNFWTGKNCPRLLLDNGKVGNKWREFIQLIQQELNTISDISSDILIDTESDSNIEDKTDDLINIEVVNDFHVDENEDETGQIFYVPIAEELYPLIVKEAKKQEIEIEKLVNLWLKQKLKENSFH